MLKANGADHVVIDGGNIADAVRAIVDGGADRVLELVGTATPLDSLAATAPGGSVCMAGMVGNAWEFKNFSPMGAIPPTVKLTTYAGGVNEFMATPLDAVIRDVENGRAGSGLDKTFPLDRIVDAHRYMEENRAVGKIVVTTE